MIYYRSVLTESLTGRLALKGSVDRLHQGDRQAAVIERLKSAPGNEC